MTGPLSSILSQIVLVGAGNYTSPDLPVVPSVEPTLRDLASTVVDCCGVRRSQMRILVDPDSPAELGDAVFDAAEEADEVLLFYYVGHGLVHTNGELYLATKNSDRRPGRIAHRAARYADIREAIHESTASAKIVILDCCFSGRAIDTLDAMEHVDLAGISGAYVLTAASKDELALASRTELHTAFTGQLIQLLRNGDPSEGPELDLKSVYRHLARSLPARNCARPQRRTTGHLDDMVLAPNPAYKAARSASLSDSPASSSKILKPLTGSLGVSYVVDTLDVSLALLELPRLDAHFERATVTRWLKETGNYVELHEALVEVLVGLEYRVLPSPVAGVFLKIYATAGLSVAQGDRLAVISIDDNAEQLKPVGIMRMTDAGVTDDKIDDSAGGSGDPSVMVAMTMPALGESVTEGMVTRWLKRLGDRVDIDEPLVEVSTDKVDTEIPSPVAGVVARIVVNEDETVDVGAELAIIVPGLL